MELTTEQINILEMISAADYSNADLWQKGVSKFDIERLEDAELIAMHYRLGKWQLTMQGHAALRKHHARQEQGRALAEWSHAEVQASNETNAQDRIAGLEGLLEGVKEDLETTEDKNAQQAQRIRALEAENAALVKERDMFKQFYDLMYGIDAISNALEVLLDDQEYEVWAELDEMANQLRETYYKK